MLIQMRGGGGGDQGRSSVCSEYPPCQRLKLEDEDADHEEEEGGRGHDVGAQVASESKV
jgi:hypothetical protein